MQELTTVYNMIVEQTEEERTLHVFPDEPTMHHFIREVADNNFEDSFDDVMTHLKQGGRHEEGDYSISYPSVLSHTPISLVRAEKIMRDEMWVSTSEMLDEPYPPIVEAFRQLPEYAVQWDKFVGDVYNVEGVQFFNTERSEFSGSKDWLDLLKSEGIPLYQEDLDIPERIHEDLHAFLRQLRQRIHTDFGTTTSGNDGPAFIRKGYKKVRVVHDGETIFPFFAAAEESSLARRNVTMEMLGTYNLSCVWDEGSTTAVSITPKEVDEDE